MQLLAKLSCSFDLRDCRPSQPERQYDWTLTADLRDYQQEQVSKALAAERGVVQAATGAGKSIMAAAIVCRLGLPTLLVVPTKLLAQQFAETFRKYTDCPVGLLGGGKHEDAPVQIAITNSAAAEAKRVQALDGDAQRSALDKQVLIIDECHTAASRMGQIIALNCPAHYRYGFSATPYRANDLEDNLLRGLCGSVIAEVGVQELQESGHLAQTDIRTIHIALNSRRMVWDETLDENALPVGWRELSYGELYRAQIVRNGWRNKQIADLANAHAADGQKVLIIISWIEHAELLTALLDAPPLFLSGQDSPKQTETKRQQFRDQQGGVCIGTSIVDTGFDVPAIDTLILAGGGEFDGRTIQRLGRGLRPSPGKEKVIVYDFTDDDKPLFAWHAKARVKAFVKLGQTVTQYETVAQALAADAPVREQETMAL